MNTTVVETKHSTGGREKRLVALTSVIGAVFLTGMKLTVGLLTGSLGILAEAAHSGLDLIAAGMTLFAVRASDRPADSEHTYGHGKIENLSALGETLLLLITCVWIVYEAVVRLFYKDVQVEVTYWSFVVMAVSIIIDLSRSRALMNTAKKYNSQALEADALHFSTDVWSSAVVIAGLAAVLIGEKANISSPLVKGLLQHADAMAALGVSAIVVFISAQLGKRTVNVLLDAAPKGLAGKIAPEVARLPGISSVDRIRVRQSGPYTFVDMTLAVARTASLEEAHDLAAQAESTVQKIVPNADVMVHIDPVVMKKHSIVEEVRAIAGQHGMSVHDMRIHDVRGQLNLELHVEVPENLTVAQAHERVTSLEKALNASQPELREIVAHIEPVGDADAHRKARLSATSEVQEAVVLIGREVPGVKDCHHINILYEGNSMSVSFHCTLVADMPITEAHEMTEQLENLLRKQLPSLGRVIIHVEPQREQPRFKS